MGVIENAGWQQAADQLHAGLVHVLETAPGSAIDEADWRFDDEDWLRDAVESVATYARWRLYGEHNFQYLRPEYAAGAVLADEMALATAAFFPLPSYPGWKATHPDWLIPDDLLAGLRAATDTYCAARPPNGWGSLWLRAIHASRTAAELRYATARRRRHRAEIAQYVRDSDPFDPSVSCAEVGSSR